MTPYRAIEIIERTVDSVQTELFGRATPEQGIVWGTWKQALSQYLGWKVVPTSCLESQTELELLAHLSTSGVLGSDNPVAFVGYDGEFTLVTDSARKQEIENEVYDYCTLTQLDMLLTE